MTPERWQQITSIFQVALQRDASSRAAYLNEACAGDDSLRREVEGMLASHDQASRFIEEPALNVAARQSGDRPSLAGQTIAHYQVLSLLGSGGTDGTAVAYIDNSNGPGQIWALPSTGGPPKQLTNFTTDSIFWFDWSRDGKQLAVARGKQLSDVVLITDFR